MRTQALGVVLCMPWKTSLGLLARYSYFTYGGDGGGRCCITMGGGEEGRQGASIGGRDPLDEDWRRDMG